MKNFQKIFGIIAIAAVIGFSFASCDNGGGGGGVNTDPKTLVITDINSQKIAGRVGIFPSGTSDSDAYNAIGMSQKHH